MADLVGEWVNQNGSRLRIEGVDAGGELRGTFQSAKGRAAQDRSYPVVGVANGEVVSFAVNFADDAANLHSISTFSGRLDGTTLHTLWVLARQFEDAERTKPTQPWNAFLVNADRFTKEGG
ncbi:MAG: hypothetical protein F4Y86_03440 [Gammaproteobacteria bacterium]|nr:hypothetical protein [Gammaproteobacteria bacterium]